MLTTGWTAEERLFRGDPAWLGGDSAYSVDLDGGRVLWLFADSFVSPTANGSRAGAPYARNSIAIQHGYSPAGASLDFHYRIDDAGLPSAFFASDKPERWFWPGPGVRIGKVLLVFLARIRANGSGIFGFAYDLPEAVLIANPDDPPERWAMTSIRVPANPWGVFVGSGGLRVEDGFVESFSCALDAGFPVYGLRWPVSRAAAGDLSNPDWATGLGTWTSQDLLDAGPKPLFSPGHTEFSVFLDPATHEYVEIQASGFPGDLMMRTAPTVTGPWSDQVAIYHPPELSCPNVFTYAGKAHPELVLDGGVALSYASNSNDFFGQLVGDLNLYFPRLVRLDVATKTVSIPGRASQ